MKVSFLLFLFALTVHSFGVSASPVDSVMQKLVILPVEEQIAFVRNFPLKLLF